MQWTLWRLILLFTSVPAAPAGDGALLYPRETYAGRDGDGVPYYIERPFTSEERRLLREHFGVEEPARLYLTDSAPDAALVYDTERDPGASRLVRTYRIGAPSIRRPGETWEQLEQRLRGMRRADFPASVRKPDTRLSSLDPEARPAFERLLREARRVGFRVRVSETRRSDERQAYLLARSGGLTFTATSKHSAGRAVDLVVRDGNLRNRRTRASWVAFRAWVTTFESGRFRIIGEPSRSWDWPHVELAEGPRDGYRSIEDLLDAARALESACCNPIRAAVHSGHDLARGGAAPLPGAGSGSVEIRVDGAAGGAALPAR
jgi:hypothetical protein